MNKHIFYVIILLMLMAFGGFIVEVECREKAGVKATDDTTDYTQMMLIQNQMLYHQLGLFRTRR